MNDLLDKIPETPFYTAEANLKLLNYLVSSFFHFLPENLQPYFDVKFRFNVSIRKYISFFIKRISKYFRILESEIVNVYYLLKRIFQTDIVMRLSDYPLLDQFSYYCNVYF
jgi:hypothetical protein